METQGYKNTFVTISADSPVQTSIIPQLKNGKKTIHLLEYELLTANPYCYNHEGLIYQLYLLKKGLNGSLSPYEEEVLKTKLFSKGHPCLRASTLIKKHGFGAHYNGDGNIALYAIESIEYIAFINDIGVIKVAGMRSKR
jgi:hypothetical protein